MKTDPSSQQKSGSLYALGAYTLWGFFPVYWKWLKALPAQEILGHRILWSFVFYWLWVCARRDGTWSWFRLLKNSSTAIPVVLASVFLTSNWLLYIWAVNNGHVVESSLGYFITPLLNVFMGKVLFKETLSRLRWIAMGLAAIGVSILAVYTGHIPWIALGLAISFSIYGALRKRISVDVFQTSTAETSVMVLPALAVVIYSRWLTPGTAPLTPTEYTFLIGSGVITGLPLIWFAQAARRLPLSSLGFFQYIAPSIQFTLGLVVFKEPFSLVHLKAFLFIWTALALFTYETVRQHRKRY